MKQIKIGIDPGVTTGVAVIIDGDYHMVCSMDILAAMDLVKTMREDYEIQVYIENPNTFQDHSKDSAAKMAAKRQGAGSIKRDYSIWVTFFTRYNIDYVPLSTLAVGSQFNKMVIFRSATGWKGPADKHARDAAKMIYRHYNKS